MKKILILIIILFSSIVIYSQDLSIPVTIHSDCASLKDVCDYLSQQTKLKIKAGKNQNDWLVYDRKSVIHVDNVPLKNLMVSISNVFDLTWESGEDGTIYLTITDEQKNKELKQRQEYFTKEKEDFAKSQKSAYEAILNKTSQSDYAKLLYDTSYYKNLIEFFNTFPNITNNMLEKNSMKFNFNRLKDNQKNSIKTLVFSYIDFYSKLQPEINNNIDIFQKENITVEINSVFGDFDEDIENDSVFSKILIKTEKQSLELVIFKPDGIYANLIANALIKANKGEDLEKINSNLAVDILKFKTEIIIAKEIPCENLKSDIFSKTYNIYKITNRESMFYNEIYKAINNMSNVNIVADYFYRKKFDIDDISTSLRVLLQNLSNSYGQKIVFNNDILEVQDKYYYIKIASIVPMAWIDYWVVRAYENQGYTIDDLITMSKLNDLKIDIEIKNNPDLNKNESKEVRFSTNEVVTKRNILRFIASLDETLLKKCYNSSISAYDLNDVQWNLLQEGLLDVNVFYVRENKNSQLISLRRNVEKVLEYVLTYSSDLSSEPVEISILANKLTIKNKKLKN